MVTGTNMDFAAARELGLVNELLPAEGFLEAVLERARGFCPPHKAAKAVGAIKRSVVSGLEMSFEGHLALERELQQQLQEIMPRNVTGVRLRLRTEGSGGPYYHYTHGLQQHEGQCQRIAHGHRSRIEIEVDEVRSSAHEEQWASRLKDAYVATDRHIVGEFEHNGIAHTRMAYRAAQGEFAMSLPSDHVYVLPNASTVEHIAEHIATTVAREAAAPVLVRAYEGVGKGALGVASGPT